MNEIGNLINIKKLDLNIDNLKRLSEISLNINNDKDFLNNYLNDELTFCLIINNEIKSVIKLSFVDEELNNKYLSNFDDEINENPNINYKDLTVSFFYFEKDIYEFLTIFKLGKVLNNCNVTNNL